MTEINHIAELAANKKVMSKSKIWPIVRDIIEHAKAEECENPHIFNEHLADLYNYFRPKPGKAPKTPYEWVLRARGKNDFRQYINHLYCDGSRIIATDGHRLHIFNTPQFAPGYYNDEAYKLPDQGNFPDLDRVIPKSTGLLRTIETLKKGERKVTSNNGKSIEAIKIGGDSGHFVQTKYLEEALAGMDSSKMVRVSVSKDPKPIKITQDNYLAVIMPMRI